MPHPVSSAVRRIRNAEHRARVDGGGGLEADAIGQMRFQAAQASFVESLAREQQVHPQRPAHSADHDEQLGELRMMMQEFGELVHDHQQRR